MTLSDAWEKHAQEWIVWARKPNHDGFWDGTWPELRAVLPPPGGLVIEIGCGEGRVGRALLGLGYTVVGIEQSQTLVTAARHAKPPLTVLRADAARLPIDDAVAGTVVACMSLHDVDDLRTTIEEASRVLKSGGEFCVAMVHPYATAQDPSTMRSPSPALTESYLRERRFQDHVEHDGLQMTFESVHRPLSTYISVFGDAGFMLSALREFGAKPIPWLLVARLQKVS